MGDYWFFNRLVVHQHLRGKGVATQLMERLVEILDEKQITLINDVNPYGDLSFNQLVEFYGKFGFLKTKESGRLIRYPARKENDIGYA